MCFSRFASHLRLPSMILQLPTQATPAVRQTRLPTHCVATAAPLRLFLCPPCHLFPSCCPLFGAIPRLLTQGPWPSARPGQTTSWPSQPFSLLSRLGPHLPALPLAPSSPLLGLQLAAIPPGRLWFFRSGQVQPAARATPPVTSLLDLGRVVHDHGDARRCTCQHWQCAETLAAVSEEHTKASQ